MRPGSHRPAWGLLRATLPALADLLLAGLLLAGALPARATAQDQETHVYLTKEEALRHVFPGAGRVVELKHLLAAAETAAIERLTGQRLQEGGFFLYAAWPAGTSGGEPVGYAVIVAEIGKVRPITHIVGVTPRGEVGQVAVMIYRESHGADVATERFMQQFTGKTLADPIRVDRDVINVAGSTLSAHAICRGVRKALAVVQVVLLDKDPAARAALLAGGTEVIAPAPDAGDGSGAGATPEPPAEPATGATHAAAGSGPGRAVVERQVMGTLCTIDARAGEGGPDDDALGAAAQAAMDEVARWDGILSDWRSDTALARLNASAPGEPVPVDGELLAWLLDAGRWVTASDGAFDPTVGALVQAWGLRTQQPARPEAAALQAARDACGFGKLAIDADARTVTRPAGMLLDPGASGKGWALDRAAEVLRARGVRSALLSFRSTLVALGPPPGADAWTVPVVDDSTGAAVTSLALSGGSLSVSSDALAAFDDGGTQRGHHVDPLTGAPAATGRLAWVLAGSGAASDALATALLLRGPELAAVPGASGGWVASPDAAPIAWPAHP